MAVYAILNDEKPQAIENVIVCEPDLIDAIAPGAVKISNEPGSPAIGWTTTNKGKSFKPPAAN